MSYDLAATKARIGELERYLLEVAESLPVPVYEARLHIPLAYVLAGKEPGYEMLRRAFGLPSGDEAEALRRFLESDEPVYAPFRRVIAQRLYHLLWRFKYTLVQIHLQPARRNLNKVDGWLRLCDPYLFAERPTLVDLEGFLQFHQDFTAYRESPADSALFAVLRAFEFTFEHPGQERTLAITPEEHRRLQVLAMDFIHKSLEDDFANRTPLQDSSNAWWGVRVGISAGDDRFIDMLPRLVGKYSDPVVPPLETASRSFAQEVFAELRTRAYTLSNAQAIAEVFIDVDPAVRDQLEAVIRAMHEYLMEVPLSPNMYLASVHYEALRNYADYVEERYLWEKGERGHIRLRDFYCAGQFACAEPNLSESIRRLRQWILSEGCRSRNAVLIYGPSSSGKTYLVQQLFAEYGQIAHFEKRRVICSDVADMRRRILLLLQEVEADPSYECPFVFIDEADTEVPQSIFPLLLDFLEKGVIGDRQGTLQRCLVFWGGSKFVTVERLRQSLDEQKESDSFQKGFDLYNRSVHKVELPSDLYDHRGQKIVVGLTRVAERFSLPIDIDLSVLQAFRRERLTQGVRQIREVIDRSELRGDVVVRPDIQHFRRTRIHVEL